MKTRTRFARWRFEYQGKMVLCAWDPEKNQLVVWMKGSRRPNAIPASKLFWVAMTETKLTGERIERRRKRAKATANPAPLDPV